MPIYMDRHDLSSVTARDVAEAHQQDLKIQDDFQCKALTYWFDEQRGMAFCLVEAPDEHCVKEMHDHAHGLVPHRIIEVDKSVVNAFLGRIEDPEPARLIDGTDLPIIDEPAFRTIMCVSLTGLSFLKLTHGSEEAAKLISGYFNLINSVVEMNGGSMANHRGNQYIISFASVSKALSCARDLQQGILSISGETLDKNVRVNMSISAGFPVEGQNELFGGAIQLARQLCEVVSGGRLIISSAVSDLLENEGIDHLEKEVKVQALRSSDEDFMYNLLEITKSGWSEPGLDVNTYCRELGLSRSQLYRKTTALTGQSPNEFLKDYRLRKALELIEKKQGNVSEIGFITGFSSPSYFSKCFKRKYGVLPSELARKIS